jgi:2-keto-4-pentenoate hydratase/2-oxohepta-3-ene-1,7-dioic acid hydratase in catechol pathway
MRHFVRFEEQGQRHWAELVDQELRVLDAAPWSRGALTGRVVAAAGAALVCPVAPSKILAVGKNFHAHAKEMGGQVPGHPLIFMKAPSALIDPGQDVVLPEQSERVDYEGELAVVVGQRLRNVGAAAALGGVFGYLSACDVTARDLQQKDGQWTRAKGFDTFCPLGARITSQIEADRLDLETRVNGEVRQRANTSEMVFSVAQVIEFISSFMTLEPGDVILMGTPEGVGPLHAGDRVSVKIDCLADLEFSVRQG